MLTLCSRTIGALSYISVTFNFSPAAKIWSRRYILSGTSFRQLLFMNNNSKAQLKETRSVDLM